MKRANWVNTGRVIGALLMCGEIFILDTIPYGDSKWIYTRGFYIIVGLIFGAIVGGTTAFYLTCYNESEVERAKTFCISVFSTLTVIMVEPILEQGWNITVFLRGLILCLFPIICCVSVLLRLRWLSMRKVSQEHPST